MIVPIPRIYVEPIPGLPLRFPYKHNGTGVASIHQFLKRVVQARGFFPSLIKVERSPRGRISGEGTCR